MTAGLPAAVLFDMDGTLVDSEPLWGIAIAELATQLGGTLSGRVRASLVGTNVPATLEVLYAALDLPAGPAERADGERWLRKRMAELLADGAPWRPGAAELLAEVRAARVPHALVTSTDRDLTELLLGQLGPFDTVVCADEAGRFKPAPDPYLRAAALLAAAPARSVAIEDSAVGAAAATAAGIRTLVVPHHVPVPPGPGLRTLPTLAGLHLDDLMALTG
ncbi:MAG: HAD family hydrolase [Mycobacteriales bacterium]